ncbi:DNA cytosine methyltransferase [Selenomonas ruminantium]|uniref:DNA cytosine methyltransferase n=1 Tax=Selenomonas ruminantium TaxID=971 RepID=UPI0026EA20CC|nr:DNA (cytosine-5-)-methyltransferase [Selenomonas ruminantium]
MCLGRGSIGHAWANDYDESTCSTYRHNICKNDNDGSVYCGDVRELDISENNPLFSEHPFDAFAFGFPCNDFSTVGEQKGIHGNYGPLYTYGVKVLKTFKPKWFLAENVSGLSSADNGGIFPKILKDLHDCGYRIYPHLYKIEEYGVPQARHRIIIIGIRDDQDDQDVVFYPPFPEPYKDKDVSVATAFADIPKDAPNSEMLMMTKRVKERLSYIRPGENAFNAEGLKAHPELQLNVKGAKISQIYRRLHPARPSYTVTGSGGGGTHIYHWSELRALTNRERARLQTFPNDYLFVGTKEEVRRQIGMAVPVEGAKVIFEAVLKTFAGVEYDHIECNIEFNNDK